MKKLPRAPQELLLLVGVMLWAAHPAAAQGDPDVIYVTPLPNAGVKIERFPHPVQTLSAQNISREGTANATQALAEQAPGVNLVNSQANPYQPTLLYHGFEISPIQGTPAGLSVYVDGARFNTPFGDLAIWSLLPDEAISSISLQSANPAFGLNALGGAISVQMKSGFTASGGEAQISGGSFGKIEGNLEYGRQAGNVAAYIDIGALHEGGWRDLQSSDIQNFYGDLGWRGSAAELHVNLTLAHSVLNGPGTVPMQLLAADPSAQFTGPNQIADKYAKLSSNFQDRITSDTSLQAVLYYTYLRENLTNGNGPNDLPCADDAASLCQDGGDGAYSTTRGGGRIPNFDPEQNQYGYYSYAQLNLNTTNTNGYGGSLQLTNTTPFLGLANNIVAGLSYDGGFTNYDAAGYVGGMSATRVYDTPSGIPSPGYILDEPGTVPVGVVIRNAYYGAYLSDTLNLTPALSVTASGRFNIANFALHDQDPPDPNASGGGLTGRHYYQHFDPGLGAAYDVTHYLTFYGSYSIANAAPTPAELSCASPEDSCSLANFMSGDPPLKQIVARNLEAGLRGTAIGPLAAILTYSADLYDSNTSDEIMFLQSPYNPVGEGYFSNIGDVRRLGVDARLNVDIGRFLVYATYSWIDATFQSRFVEQSNSPYADENGNITVNPGDHLPGIPDQIFKLGATYRATPRWNIGLTLLAQSSSYLYGDESNQAKPLPGYAVLNFFSSYQLTPNLQVFGKIDNVTDQTYYNYGTFSPTGVDGGVYVAQVPNYSDPRSYSIAAPIGVFVGAKYRF